MKTLVRSINEIERATQKPYSTCSLKTIQPFRKHERVTLALPGEQYRPYVY